MKRLFALSLACVVPLATAGCAAFLERAMDAAGSQAGDAFGRAIGDRVGAAVAGHALVGLNALTPELTQAYAMGLFAAVYYHGGYAWGGKPYAVGEFTQWQGNNMAQGNFFEKAYVKREANGQEWWRVRVQDTEDGKVEEAVFEALFSAPAKDGEQKILRMRAKLPNQAQGAEVPITAENQSSWVLRPTSRLTPESVKGATVGVERVAIAAGTYQARHVRFAHGAGQVDWWLVDSVPGGVVKYSVQGSDGERAVMQLKKTGKGAKPMLL